MLPRPFRGPALACLCLAAPALAATSPRLADMSLEELANLEITTPTKSPESAFRTPAAVYVLTQDDIRRSGATSVPEALRVVPGVEVSRIDAYKWAVGIRGFGTRLSKAVLVLIDGRSVYTPLFAGVYWEAQDIQLWDVERIEVIRGPGATIWGANSLNGVINIVTRAASQTQGWRATALTGNVERTAVGLRYGGASADGTLHYRAYLKGTRRGPLWHPDGSRFDEGELGGLGFRADWSGSGSDQWILQGDLYGGPIGNRLAIASYSPPAVREVEGTARLSGGNLLARWHRTLPRGSELRVHAYYDRTTREDLNFEEDRDTFDLDLLHRVPLGRQHVTWGIGARSSRGATREVVPTVLFTPAAATDRTVSAFLQDEIPVGDALALTLGAKVLDESDSGVEVQPSVRLAFTPSPQQTYWAAVTRAVRTPSRVDTDLRYTALVNPAVPLYLRLTGERGFFDTEKVLGYEAGSNLVLGRDVSVSVAAFYNRYDDLLGVETRPIFVEPLPEPAHQVLPVLFGNFLEGRSRGIEVAPSFSPQPRLRLKAAYSYLHLDLRTRPGSTDSSTVGQVEGSSPKHRLILQAFLDLPGKMDVDLTYRRVSALPYQQAPAYDTADLVFTWGILERLTLSLAGQNLFDAHHKEFGSDGGPDVEVRRSFHARLSFRD